LDVNQHPPAVDIRELQMAELRVPHAGRVQDHQHRAVRQTVGGVDHPRHFLDAQDLRQSPRGFGVRRVVEQVPPLQRLHEEEAQCCDVEADRQRAHLSLAQQIRLVRSQMRLIQPVRPALEMSSELLDGVEIGRDRGGREVPALELLQHHLPTMGHKTPPVTPPYPADRARLTRSVRRASGLVQTPQG
jgi:hypothetical protein